MSTSVVDHVLERLLTGGRPSLEQAADLAARADLITLGLVARQLSRPEQPVTFTVDRTIVLSNICTPDCVWCAGNVPPGDPAGWALDRDRVLKIAARAVEAGARQLVLQGGHRRDLPLEQTTGLLQALKAAFPQVELIGFSPSEVLTWRAGTGLPVPEILARLRAAGLRVLLGAGGEAVTSRTPEHRLLLDGWDQWDLVVQECGRAGLPVLAPVPFGLGETYTQRAAYLLRLRELQAQTGAIVALLPLAPAVAPPMPGEGDELRLVESARGPAPDPAQLMATGHEYLRMVALSRLVVDNVGVICASPLTQGAKVAQVALDCGANDFGGTHLQFELAELAAGRVGPMTAPEFARLIRDAGRRPALRDAAFRDIVNYDAE